jgi:hypothetical protein
MCHYLSSLGRGGGGGGLVVVLQVVDLEEALGGGFEVADLWRDLVEAGKIFN